MSGRLPGWAAALMLVFSSLRAFGALLVYEGFDAPEGTVLNTPTAKGATSFGWQATIPTGWYDQNSSATRHLRVGAAVQHPWIYEVGGSAQGHGAQQFRVLQTRVTSGVRWISFTIDAPDATRRYANLALFDGQSLSTERVAFGAVQDAVVNYGPALNYGIFRMTPFATAESSVPLSAGAHLFVVRYDITGRRIDMWVDPEPDVEPVVGTDNWVGVTNITQSNMYFDRVRVELSQWQGTSETNLDEIRIGETFADVTPSTLADNDLFSNALALAETSGRSAGLLSRGTLEANEVLGPGEGERTLWYRFTAPQTGYLVARPTNGASVQITALAGASLSELTLLQGTPGSGPDGVVVPVEQGKEYYLRVSDRDGSTGAFEFEYGYTDNVILVAPMVASERANNQFTFQRIGDVSKAGYVLYRIEHGTTTSADFQSTTGQIQFSAGTTTRSISLNIQSDGLVEGDETARFVLFSPVGLGFGPNSASLIVQDFEDGPSNDRGVDPALINGPAGSVPSSLVGADSESADINEKTVYYKWKPGISGRAVLKLSASLAGRKLRVFRQSGPGNSLLVADESGEDGSHVSFTAESYESYLIEIAETAPVDPAPFQLVYDMDLDNDLLPNSEEIAIGSDPLDQDSDDDGVKDGAEKAWAEDTDSDNIPNVLDPDSDGDGIFDGTEIGITEAGPGTDVSKGYFVADADAGLTVTDPTLADSDEGGMPDGEEDANHNGAVDPGETDPNSAADDLPALFTFVASETTLTEAAGPVTVTIQRSRNFKYAAKLNLSFLSAAGRAGAEDFEPLPQSVDFAPGQTTAQVALTAKKDNIFEGPEICAIGLSAIENAEVPPGTRLSVTVQDSDPMLPQALRFFGVSQPLVTGQVATLRVTVSRGGQLTGTAMIQGKSYTVRGKVPPSGGGEITFGSRNAGFTLQYQVTDGGDRLLATLNGSSGMIELDAASTNFHSKNNPALPDGQKQLRFTSYLTPEDSQVETKWAIGWASGSLSSNGNVRVAGRTPDGAPFTAAAQLGGDKVAWFLWKYKAGTAALTLGLNLDLLSGSQANSSGTWRAKSSTGTQEYLSLEVSNALFTPLKGESAIPDVTTSSPLQLLLEGFSTQESSIWFSSLNLLRGAENDPAKVQLKIDPKTGIFQGKATVDGKPAKLSGVVIQEAKSLKGQFQQKGTPTGTLTAEPSSAD